MSLYFSHLVNSLVTIIIFSSRTGPIFDHAFISSMTLFAKEMKFADYSQNMFQMVLEESECPLLKHNDPVVSLSKENKEDIVDCNAKSPDEQSSEVSAIKSGQATVKNDNVCKTQQQESDSSNSGKRSHEDNDNTNPNKKFKTDDNACERLDLAESQGYRNCAKSGTPMFYYNMQKSKVSNVDLPK